MSTTATQTASLVRTCDYNGEAAMKAHSIASREGWRTITFGIHYAAEGGPVVHVIEGRQGYKALESVGICYATQDCVPHDWDSRNTCTICGSVLCG